jgi:ribonuclease III
VKEPNSPLGLKMPDPSPRDDESWLERCQRLIEYRFQDLSYLRAALTHASGADHRLASNERLEFLGDAILGAVVCERLFRDFPEFLEGDLTRIKSVVVSRSTCAKISKNLGIDEYLILGKGMGSQRETPASLLANVFESLVGAIYLDGGFEAARTFIERHVGREIDETVDGQGGVNYKSHLQQTAQRQFGATPTYLLLDEKGPDHSKCFKIAAQIGRERYAPAWGPNKKDAEQRAARNALSQIAGDAPPHEAD